MTSKTKVLLTGATGYLGGTVLTHLMRQPDFSTYELTALLRSPEKAEKLRKLGINAIIGSHEDKAFMEELAANADVVISVADSDNDNAARATLTGLRRRHSLTGVAPHYIHTSGTGVFSDRAAGAYATDVVFDDANAEQFESIPDTAFHRNVDLLLLNADQEGYIKSYLIMPSVVYGKPSGPLVDQEIQNTIAPLVPTLALVSASIGRSVVSGEGKNILNNVHIDDTAELYITLLKSIKKDAETPHGRDGYFIAENGEHSMRDLAQAIGKALVAVGKIDIPEPRSFTKEELHHYFGSNQYFDGESFFGVNARGVGNRSRAIGWKPVFTTKDYLASVQPDVEAMVKEGRI